MTTAREGSDTYNRHNRRPPPSPRDSGEGNKYVGQGPRGPRSGPEIQVFGPIFDKIGQNSAPEAPFELFPGLSILISPPASVSGHGEAR